MVFDSDRLWRAIEAGDPRFDGWVFCAVKTTGIYCRPSCPARTPKRENVAFFATAASAQRAGFRACKRCRPDATPGSPEWDLRADLVGRAMRLIADGMVDRNGVSGLAQHLGYTERHLRRQLMAVVGAGPLELARAQRAQSARILIETTTLPITEVAFGAGFQSVRQFNATIQEVFALTPSELRDRARREGRSSDCGVLTLRLPYRAPLDAEGLLAFLGQRAVPAVEEMVDGAFRRSLRLPKANGAVELRAAPGYVQARYWLEDLRDLSVAMQRSRALLDLDSDPDGVAGALGQDELIGPMVKRAPGRRVPGHVDGSELAVRAVLGQQISLRGASTLAGRLVGAHGDHLKHPLGGVTHAFPSVEALAQVDPASLAMPLARRSALLGLASSLARRELTLDCGADRAETRRQLVSLPGIGPWTADYISMRALRDPDAFLPSDLGVRHALQQLGQDGNPTMAGRLAQRWRPYRSYAVVHLWASLRRPQDSSGSAIAA